MTYHLELCEAAGGWAFVAFGNQKQQFSKSPHIPIYDVGIYQRVCNQAMPTYASGGGAFVNFGDPNFKVSTYTCGGGGEALL